MESIANPTLAKRPLSNGTTIPFAAVDDYYLNFTNPGRDGVVIGAEHSFRLATATNQYAPKYIPLNDEHKHLAGEIADGFFEQFRLSFKTQK
ncbi:10545_t:CDS:2 [Cetraspora pellucida]|uniref:10545_t:CDS:1 n=1 Tax=Cetraspora pellucida TaxID=1433469 RepID=A0A9N9CF99_9GLOM|nr:10545_t:CDS:2 [Cetraspora pellucida]